MDGDINTLAPARVTATDSVARDVIDRGHPGIRPKTVRWFVIVGLLLGLILGGLYGFNRYREQAMAPGVETTSPAATAASNEAVKNGMTWADTASNNSRA